MSDFGKLLGPMARRIGNLLARGSVAAVNGTGKMRTLQLRMLAGEVKDNVEHFEPYGFTSEVLPGSEHITAFFDGDRSHGVVLVAADRRYRLQLQPGEVAIFTNHGDKVVIHADGTIEVVASTKVQISSPLVSMSGNLTVQGNIVAQGDISDHGNKAMAGMRGTYNGHTHTDPQGGTVPAPNQAM